MQRVDPGFDVAGVMTGRVMLADPTAFDTGQKRVDFWRRMTAAVGALPGVSAISVSGALLGVMGAFWLTRLMRTMLFSVSATDPLTFVAVPMVLMGVALAACYIPARRAMRVDPVTALRAD